jgi:hypothetical protein
MEHTFVTLKGGGIQFSSSYKCDEAAPNIAALTAMPKERGKLAITSEALLESGRLAIDVEEALRDPVALALLVEFAEATPEELAEALRLSIALVKAIKAATKTAVNFMFGIKSLKVERRLVLFTEHSTAHFIGTSFSECSFKVLAEESAIQAGFRSECATGNNLKTPKDHSF